jgi:hypothetical protein
MKVGCIYKTSKLNFVNYLLDALSFSLYRIELDMGQVIEGASKIMVLNPFMVTITHAVQLLQCIQKCILFCNIITCN